jgi:hypothetical protein
MATERDNRMVWDGRPGHYEVWYATLSHRESGTGFWIRYVVEAPALGQGEPYAELWFARFDGADPANTFGMHRRSPVSALRATSEPFSVAIGDAEVRHRGMRGAISGEGHEVRWDVSWPAATGTHLHYPPLIYRAPQVDTKILAPNLAVPVEGQVEVDGRTYRFTGDSGGQSHVWGRKHAYQWGWSQCNAFEGAPGATFVSTSGRLRRGQVILPQLTLFTLILDGEELSFREFWKLPLARSQFSTGSYHLVGITAENRVEAHLTCRAEDIVLAEYLDPDGDPAFCHYTGCGDATITVKKRSGLVGRWRDHRTLVARRTAHFEWGGRAGDVVSVKKTHVRL